MEINNQKPNGKINGTEHDYPDWLQVFIELGDFSHVLESATNCVFNLSSVTDLNTDFIESTEEYLLLNIKEYGSDKPDNLLFLSENGVYAFSNNCPSLSDMKGFAGVLDKPFGKSTVLCFLILDKIVDHHKKQLEYFIDKIRAQEENFNHSEYRKLSLEMERYSDRLEEFHDLLLELEETRYRQMETKHITFDYGVLIAESQSLQGRCRRRIGGLKEIRQEHEMLANEDLNKKVVKLNDVVKRLTAITVIFMLPTLIASHFGMNFQFMPELHVSWAYPTVLATEVAIIISGAIIFRKVGWL